MTKEKSKENKQEMRRVEEEYLGRLYFDESLKEDDFEYRVVNDSPGRIKYLERLGYEIVESKDIKPGMNYANDPSATGAAVEFEVGIYRGSQRAVLMRIRKEDYAKRLEFKKQKIDQQTGQMAQTGIPTQYGEITLGK